MSMRNDQTTLKFWEEGVQPPALSIGDRVRWEDSVDVEHTGTVVGVNPKCYGERFWKYIIVPDGDGKTRSYYEVRGVELETIEDREKEEHLMKFGRRVKDIA